MISWIKKKFTSGSVPVVKNAMDSKDLYDLIAADSGGNISIEAAKRLPTVETCVRILSESLAMLPIDIYKRFDDDSGRDKAKDHPLYDLLRYKPNEWQTAYQYIECMCRDMLADGAGSSIKTVYGGKVKELIYEPANRVHVDVTERRKVSYKIGSKSYSPDEFLYIPDASDDGFRGKSRLTRISRALSSNDRAEVLANCVFMNNGVIPGYLWTEQPLNEVQRNEFSSGWGAFLNGDKAGQTPVLAGGIQYKELQQDFSKLQFTDIRKFMREEILAIYRVPPQIAQIYEKSTSWGTGIEQVSLLFVIYSLMPIIRRFEQAFTTSLLTARERVSYQIEFNLRSMLRGDMKARADFYYKGLLMGWFSINDVRRLENLNPVEGGNTYRAPINTADILAKTMEESDEQNQ